MEGGDVTEPHPYPTSLWFDTETLKALEKLQQQLGLSRSATIRYAIRRVAGNEDMHMDEIRASVRNLADLIGITSK